MFFASIGVDSGLRIPPPGHIQITVLAFMIASGEKYGVIASRMAAVSEYSGVIASQGCDFLRYGCHLVSLHTLLDAHFQNIP